MNHPTRCTTSHAFVDDPPAGAGRLELALACDGAYAMPLATTLRSMAEANAAHWPVQVHVLVERFPHSLRQKVAGSLPEGSAAIHWVDADLTQYRQYSPTSGTARPLPVIAYARLLLPLLLPAECHRVLYLDPDILVLQDLQALWGTDLHGASVGAVRDGMDGLRFSGAPAFEHVPRVARYFNAGVLLLDLDEWRARGIAERANRYLQAHPASPYSDQDALNVACDRDWHELNPHWNHQPLYHRGSLAALGDREWPGIVHFVTGDKPWLPGIPNRDARCYDGFRRRTLFARTPSERLRDGVVGCWADLKIALKRAPLVRQALQRIDGRPRVPPLPTIDQGPT